MKMRTIIILLQLTALLYGQDAKQIVAESQRRQNVKSQKYQGMLQVIDASGKVTEKSWATERMGSWGTSKLIIRFTAPAEVKGVALLVVNHPDRASDQWMWIPSIGRDRRVAMQDRKTRFFGTDFSFEDLEERDVDQYDWKTLGDETIDGAPCWKLESRPKEARASQYTSNILWIRKDNYVASRLESYTKDQLIRKLSYKNIEQVQGIWTARRLEMYDVKRKSTTVLKLEKLAFNTPMKDEGFTIQALRREQ
jgi:outer membrane lipoprotein-sorting protein